MGSMMEQNEFVNNIFMGNNNDGMQPIEYAFRFSQSSVVKHLFDKKEVQDRYKNDEPLLFRLFMLLFSMNSNVYLSEYVLSTLQMNKEKVIEMLSYICPQQGKDYQ